MGKKARLRKVKIIERNLGRNRARGTYNTKTHEIAVDPRLKSRAYLDTLIHEGLHCAHPRLTEDSVLETADFLAKLLWKQGFRRIRP